MIKTLVVIVGPTGIGKTDTSIKIAQHYKTEIISADSRQIYKETCIGTATPDSQQLHTVKHNFIQTQSIHNYYNASMFEKDVLKTITNLFSQHNIIIMTGGSMLYIDAVCDGIDDLPKIDIEVREELIKRYQNEGLENLRIELKKIDPEYYAITDLKNHKRILHALEIFYITGKTFSSFRTNTKKPRDFNIVKIGLNTDRPLLHERINKRVDQMIANGLIDEARTLFPYRNLNSLNTVGYKELFDYFDGTIELNKAVELIKRNSRRYARRQLTWFRRDKNIKWFDINQTEEIDLYLENILPLYESL